MDEQTYIFYKNGQSVSKYEKSWTEIEAEDTEWIEIAVNQAQIEEGILYVSPTMTIISDFDDNCLQNLLSIEKKYLQYPHFKDEENLPDTLRESELNQLPQNDSHDQDLENTRFNIQNRSQLLGLLQAKIEMKNKQRNNLNH